MSHACVPRLRSRLRDVLQRPRLAAPQEHLRAVLDAGTRTAERVFRGKPAVGSEWGGRLPASIGIPPEFFLPSFCDPAWRSLGDVGMRSLAQSAAASDVSVVTPKQVCTRLLAPSFEIY